MSESTTLILTIDGAASNNQHEDEREAAVGYVVQEGSETLIENGEYLGKGPSYTNNVAEYQAIKFGADEIASSWDPETVGLEIQTDSELVAKQLTGEYGINDQKMQRNHAEVMETLSTFGYWEITHLSEAPNNTVEIADNLAGDVLDT